jgi:hypothetical protein
MASDRFTEITTTGWISRLGKSITSLFLGMLLIAVSAALLWWNEGRTVHTSRGLSEGAKVSVEASAGLVDPANEGKLIHVVGQTTLEKPAVDETFGITGPYLVKLRRSAQMFQWVEEKKETTRTKVGGGEEKVTEYTYTKKWDDVVRNSSSFRHPEGHKNPPPRLETKVFLAQGVKLGAYRLPKFLLEQWSDFESCPLPAPANLPETWRGQAHVDGGWLVLSQTPENPAVGDLRVQFSAIKTGEASVLAQQVRDTFEAFRTSHGTAIARIESGVRSRAAMFASAEAENNLLAWIIRLVGLVLMFLGFLAALHPLKVLADVLPLAGSIVGTGTALVAILLSLTAWFTTVALSWLWFRPLLGIALLGVAGLGALFLLKIVTTPKTA